MKMKAAIISEAEKMHVGEVNKPIIGSGEALIKVQNIGICGTDIHLLHGQHATAEFPLIPGHEFVGKLAEIDSDDQGDFIIGERVVAQEIISCGHCSACAKGEDNACQNLKIIGVHAPGGFAEYVKVPVRKLCKVPPDMDLELATLIEPMAVAVHDVRSSGLKVGETVLVIGGGPIGMLIAIVAKAAGARKVVISEVKDFRREFAKSLGFEVVNPLDENFEEQIRKLSDEEGFDVSFEVAGVPTAIGNCIDYTKNTGTVVVVAITQKPYLVNTGKLFAKELKVQGVRIHNFYDFKGAIDILNIPFVAESARKMISAVYSLDQINEAFEYAEHGKDSFKVIVKVSE